MTPKFAKSVLPVIQAFAEGKTVQYKYKDEWVDSYQPGFSMMVEWRVKPEKKVAWINIYADRSSSAGLHRSRSIADESAAIGRVACIKVEYEEGEGL